MVRIAWSSPTAEDDASCGRRHRRLPRGEGGARGFVGAATSAHLAHGLHHFVVVCTVARLAGAPGPTVPAGVAIPVFFAALGAANYLAAHLEMSWRHRPFWTVYGLACLPMAALLQSDLADHVRIAATAAFLMPVHNFGIAHLVIERIEPPAVPLHSVYGIGGTVAGLVAATMLDSSPLLFPGAMVGLGGLIALRARREPDRHYRQRPGTGRALIGRELFAEVSALALCIVGLHASISFAIAPQPLSWRESGIVAGVAAVTMGWQWVEAARGARNVSFVSAPALACSFAVLAVILWTGSPPDRAASLFLFAFATISFSFANGISGRWGPGTPRQRLLTGIAANALAAAALAAMPAPAL